jgi:hypothetical protein
MVLKKKYRTIIIVVIIMIAVSPFLFIIGLIGCDHVKEDVGREAFNSVQWKDTILAFSKNPIRIKMVDDLFSKHNLKGLEKDSVVSLLGVPEETEKFKDWDFVYWLGPERGFMGIDSEWLVVKFDDQGKVKEYRLVAD